MQKHQNLQCAVRLSLHESPQKSGTAEIQGWETTFLLFSQKKRRSLTDTIE